jgi:tetratricopeptide (TPR) repeat protein
MGAAAGMWQTGPGGLALNLIASALWKVGADGLAKMFAKPTVDQVVEKLLLHNGLMVPSKSVSTWFAKPEALGVLGRIEPRAFDPGPVANMNLADAKALDEAAFSFRVHAGHRRTWTDGQGVHALQLVVTCVLASDTGVQHELSQLRTEHKLDAGFVQALEDLAVVREEVFRTGQTADRIEAGVQQLLQRGGGGQPLEVVVPASNVPFVNVGLFVDRDGLLDRLGQGAGSAMALTAVYGMGGVGKSTVAKMYAYQYGDRFDFVWWINAAAPEGHDVHQTPQTVLDDLAALGAELGVIDKDVDDTTVRARKTVTALNSDRWHWLLIYDNAEHPDAMIGWYPTPKPGSQVVFTTRSTMFDEIAGELAVNTFTPETGARFLCERVAKKNPDAGHGDQHDAARDLAVYLGGLPLALEQAGAYVARRPTERFATLLVRLKRDLPGALPRPPAGYPEPAHRTYLHSINTAQQEHPLAPTILLILSYADPDTGFPAELLYDNDIGTSDEIDDAVAVLAELSLLTQDASGLHLHRLVQQARQLDATPEQRVDAHTTLIDTLLKVFVPARDPVGNRACQPLLPHADHTIQTELASVEQRWRLASWAAITVQSGGDPIGAVDRYETALNLTATLGDRHPNTLTSRANLANSYWSAGRTTEAITLEEQVLADSVEILGDRHPNTLTSRANLANSYWSAGRTTEAIALLSTAVEIAGQLNHDHPYLASWQRTLAEWNDGELPQPG